LLKKYLPVPSGFDADTFYSCTSCYENLIDQQAWDAAGFEADFRERIYDPMVHSLEVLATWPYVTRLYTRISPHEMLADPFFEEVEGLGNVPNRLGAQRFNRCCDTAVRLPGGREVLLDQGAWPQWPDEMPWAERIEEFQPAGPPATMVDNTELIDSLVHQHFVSNTCEPGGGTTGGEETTGDGMGSDTAGITGADSSSDGTAGAGSDTDGAAPISCACSSRHGGEATGGLLALLGLLGLRRRRR
jgi:MYXO-CTERM domain-containing protein